MTPAPDHRSGHVPEGLIYGPVASRRFGRSLGISLSDPALVLCEWRCPYCQLGNLPYRPDAAPTPLTVIQQALINHLAAVDEHAAIDVVTIAGSGEPTQHPDFPAFIDWLKPLAHRHGWELILLSNGDGIRRPAVAQALRAIDRCYIKWDPGPIAGSWRRKDSAWHAARRDALARLPDLRIQAMLFDTATGGNHNPESWDRWIEDMSELHPTEIHLTTIERDPHDARLRAVDRQELDDWAQRAHDRLGIPVTAFG